MYGMVLMAALATGPETPSFGWGYGCSGCTGCTGMVVGSCYGSSCFGSSCYGGCYGSSCSGGGGLLARLCARFKGRSCYGSSCYSTSCCGWSSCMGSSCMGSSCFGSACMGTSCMGGAGYGGGGGYDERTSCFGYGMAGVQFVGSMPPNPPGVSGPFGPQGRWPGHGVYYAEPGAIPRGHPVTITPGPGSGCFGDSYLNYSCYGSPIYLNRSATLTGPTTYGDPIYSPTSWGRGVGFGSGPVYYGVDFHPNYNPCVGGLTDAPYTPKATTPPQVRIDRGEHEVAKAKPNAAPARLTVEVPADAKLYVDGAATKGEGTTRNFHTPDLPAGQTFYYELKAELVVDGRTVTESKTVLVKAGEALTESFPKVMAAANQAKDALAKR